MDFISSLIGNWEGILTAVTAVVTAAAAITALTKTPKDDGVVSKIRTVLDIIAFNFGNAKNKDSK